MATKENLGILNKIDLRTIWEGEASDFTPWLAQEENLKLLGDTIGIEMELEAQEKEVGPFRADILCRDQVSEDYILIENQLEKTDHKHLGQLITYSAGLDAVTIVWVAQRFTEEHRAALDWLNHHTGENVNLFGLEIELWRIGNSAPAPKFNIVSKPNDWSKAITQGNKSDDELTEVKKFRLGYWTAFINYLENRKMPYKLRKPNIYGWIRWAFGTSKFNIVTGVSPMHKRISVALIIKGKDAKGLLDALRKESEDIQSKLGAELEWRVSQKRCSIRLHKFGVEVENKNDWDRQHQWLYENMLKFHEVFGEKVKTLEPIDDEDDIDDEDQD